MEPNIVFQISNLLILPFWVLMVFAPDWNVTRKIILSGWSIFLLCFLYGILVIPDIATILPLVAKPELAPLMKIMNSPAGATVVWLHMIAFDLFVGRWIYIQTQKNKVSAFVAGPILFLTLMFGPLGYATFKLIGGFYYKIKEEGESI